MGSRRTRITRREFAVGCLGLGAAGLVAAVVRAGGPAVWPDRPVRLIVPYPAGGSVDLLTRILAERLESRFGQPFVIENKPGAAGNIGITALAGSPADGYTLASATVGHFSINQFLYERLPYDPDRDFAPISLTWELPNVFAVPSHVPAKTVQDFVAWAKPRRGISFGSSGVGTSTHLCAALLAARTGIDAVHVPFRGAAQTIPAMLSGDVTYSVDNLASYMAYIESGQIRALAVTSAQRWPSLPDVPTMAEAGVQNLEATSWAAFVAPAGTPRAIVDALVAAQREIAADPAIQHRFEMAGARCLSSDPETLTAKAVHERPLWKEMVRVSGLSS